VLLRGASLLLAIPVLGFFFRIGEWSGYWLVGRTMNETSLSHHIQLGVSEQGVKIFRNNTGVGWVGEIVRRTADTITLRNPRPLHAGLTVGSSDLIGWTPVTITQEMVGRKLAIFTAIEVKAPREKATPKPAQKIFLQAVEVDGGFAMCVNNLDVCLQTLYAKTMLY
jgi:hypothetical protein